LSDSTFKGRTISVSYIHFQYLNFRLLPKEPTYLSEEEAEAEDPVEEVVFSILQIQNLKIISRFLSRQKRIPNVRNETHEKRFPSLLV